MAAADYRLMTEATGQRIAAALESLVNLGDPVSIAHGGTGATTAAAALAALGGANESTPISIDTQVTTTGANTYARVSEKITIPANAEFGLYAEHAYTGVNPTGILLGFDGSNALGIETNGRIVSFSGINSHNYSVDMYVWAKTSAAGTNEIYIRGWHRVITQ